MTEMTSCQNESDSPWRPPGEIHRTPNPERKHMEVSYNRGAPKWMVFKENHIKMDDLGLPCFRKPPYNKSHQWTQHHLEHIYFNPLCLEKPKIPSALCHFQPSHSWLNHNLFGIGDQLWAKYSWITPYPNPMPAAHMWKSACTACTANRVSWAQGGGRTFSSRTPLGASS